jgi:hypothetical protein
MHMTVVTIFEEDGHRETAQPSAAEDDQAPRDQPRAT